MSTSQPITIVTCKYTFYPQNKLELRASENESFQLLKDAGDGWLFVKPIGRLGNPGLIPRSFCSLRRMNVAKTETFVLEIDGAEITSVRVKTISNYESRLWYGIELLTTNGKARYLSRYYQDFYMLQLNLLDASKSTLPRLPGPTPQLEHGEALKSRCQDLSTYLGELFNLAMTRQVVKAHLENWLKMESHDVEVEEIKDSKDISSILKPKATVLPSNIVKNLQLQVPELDSSASSTPSSSPVMAQAPLLGALPFAPTKPVFEEKKIKVKVFHGDDAFVFKIAAKSSVAKLKMAISEQINLNSFKLHFDCDYEKVTSGMRIAELAENKKLVITVL